MTSFMKIMAITIFCIMSTFMMNNAYSNHISDKEITHNVKQKVEAEDIMGIDYIDIHTKNGIVYIDGKFETDKQASRFIQTVQSTKGVKDVDTSKIIIANSKSPMVDSYITAKIKGLFLREELFGDLKVPAFMINVETKNQVVYLTGKAKNDDEVQNAVRLAKSVKGVKYVNYSISITD